MQPSRREYEPKPVKVADIILDPECQPRVSIDTAIVEEYAERLQAGAIFENIEVYQDGKKFWCADGFHRVMAYKAAERGNIPANVHQGGKREAILHAVGANATHGLKRTNADKRRAVEMLLRDAEWQQWSDRQIADQCGVSNNFVGVLRKEFAPRQLSSDDSCEPVKRMGKDGKERSLPRHNPRFYIPPDDTSVTEEEREIHNQGVDEFNSHYAAKAKAIINGVESEDPKHIAKLRAAGKIPADAVVTIEGEDAPPIDSEEDEERAAIQVDDVSDDDWVKTLPLASKLKGYQLKIFKADAIYYRRIEKARKSFLHHHQNVTAQVDRDHRNIPSGDYRNRIAWALKLEHPKDWLVCAAPEHGGCGGTGSVLNLECPKCNKRGYYVFPR
jgi:hypothetical protein